MQTHTTKYERKWIAGVLVGCVLYDSICIVFKHETHHRSIYVGKCANYR